MALQEVLSPEDWTSLDEARKSLGTRHDGITVLDGEMKRIFHTIREPGESCMVERGELVRILQRGAGHVEFNRQVETVRDMGDVVLLKMDDGEVLTADILIGELPSCECVRLTDSCRWDVQLDPTAAVPRA